MRSPVTSPFVPPFRPLTHQPGTAAPTRGRLPVALLLMLSVGVACSEDPSAGVGEAHPTWVTEAEHDFGDSPEIELFFMSPYVRVDPARGRVFVMDGPSHQVSAWTPDGALLFRVGREGEGPGEFLSLGSLYIEADGTFRVQESGRGRYTRFMTGGELVGTTTGPLAAVSFQGLPLDLHWPADGSYLGTPTMYTRTSPTGKTSGPVPRRPVVRVRDLGNGRWSDPEPLLWLDVGNLAHVIPIPDGHITRSQPFGDPDYVRFEPGAAVVMRSKGSPGAVELIEVDASGDTVWHRRVELPPRRLTAAMVDEAAEGFLALRVPPGTPSASLRQGFHDALYQPEYVPPAEGPPILTASREVWIRTPELLDTLRVYYAVPRGDPAGLPRRVLLPEAFWVSDATETHVWGVRWDSMDRPHIVGRRLVPSPA